MTGRSFEKLTDSTDSQVSVDQTPYGDYAAYLSERLAYLREFNARPPQRQQVDEEFETRDVYGTRRIDRELTLGGGRTVVLRERRNIDSFNKVVWVVYGPDGEELAVYPYQVYASYGGGSGGGHGDHDAHGDRDRGGDRFHPGHKRPYPQKLNHFDRRPERGRFSERPYRRGRYKFKGSPHPHSP